ncbi:MAG: pentapeptide repeat-containing protein [Pseudomonadota bacterium]|nr:pentapeptide repeat-containing protein [Pseudomonadota bacterium]
MTGTDLSGCVLKFANLSGANLTGTNLSTCDLRGADFTNAVLTRAKFDRTRIGGAVFTGITGKGSITGLEQARGREDARFD